MPDLSQTQPFAFTCEGGLVKSRSTFIMQPGQALELLNFEPDIEGGYRRINGFRKHVNHIVPQTSASTESGNISHSSIKPTLLLTKSAPLVSGAIDLWCLM